MTCEEKQFWENLTSLLLGQKITLRQPKKAHSGCCAFGGCPDIDRSVMMAVTQLM